ncbi:unnamed protein product [Ilex paraguariensis]|uniref:Uncharacterized protein n=1 Tax=Ilex paraguariensis TaxID=185542 RepID=A0ABC8SUX5_9AQUA
MRSRHPAFWRSSRCLGENQVMSSDLFKDDDLWSTSPDLWLTSPELAWTGGEEMKKEITGEGEGKKMERL